MPCHMPTTAAPARLPHQTTQDRVTRYRKMNPLVSKDRKHAGEEDTIFLHYKDLNFFHYKDLNFTVSDIQLTKVAL